MIYLLVLIIVLIGVVKFDKLKLVKPKDSYFYFCLILLVLVAGLRYKVGGDSIVYHYSYESWPELQILNQQFINNSRYNVLFIYFWSLCKSISSNVWVYQIIHAAIVNSVMLLFFKKHCKHVFLCILFYVTYYYFFYNMEIVRASFSVCCFLLAFDSLYERKWLSYYFYVIIAIGFHLEALVLLLFPLFQILSKVKISLLSVFGCIAISFAALELADFIPFFNRILLSMSMEGGVYLNTRLSNESAYILIILTIIPAAGILLVNSENKSFKFSWPLFLYIFISVQTLKYTVFFGRILDFLHPILIVTLVQSIERRKILKKTKLLTVCVTCFLFVCLFTYIKNSYYPDWKRYYPYSSVIFPEEFSEREWYITDILNNR